MKCSLTSEERPKSTIMSNLKKGVQIPKVEGHLQTFSQDKEIRTHKKKTKVYGK